MSKLLDLLNRVSQGAPTPIGFGTSASRQPRPPNLALLGQLPPQKNSRSPHLEELGLDVVILHPGESPLSGLDKLAETMKGAIWGMALPAPSPREIAALKEAGCDFLLFPPGEISLEVLGGKELGRVLEVSSSLSEQHRLILGTLPVDALMVHTDDEASPLTLRHVMDIQTLISYSDKPALLFRRRPLNRGELEGLRNAGMDGVVLDASLLKKDVVRQLREEIASLPQRRERPERTTPTLPYPSPSSPAAPPRREDDDDDDEDY